MAASRAPKTVVGTAMTTLVQLPENWSAVPLGLPLQLGLKAKDLVLLVLALAVGAISQASGRTSAMPGAAHLGIFAAFLFLAFVP